MSYLASDRVHALVLLEVFVALLLVLFEFLDNVRADVRVLLLDPLRHCHGILSRDHVFATLAKQVLNERSQVTSSNGNTLDRGANNISLSLEW